MRRMDQPLDSGHDLWPWALARDVAPSLGYRLPGLPSAIARAGGISRRRIPSRSEGKGRNIGATGSARVAPRAKHSPWFMMAPRGISRQAWGHLTPFQQLVYRATCRIPRGQTRSYAWIAKRIGRPQAARAVGNALHINPFAPRVPCHRVIHADGTAGGYAGPLGRKLALLRAEGWKRLSAQQTARSTQRKR